MGNHVSNQNTKSSASLNSANALSVPRKESLSFSPSFFNLKEKNYPEFLLKLAKVLKEKTLKEENKSGISETVFQKYLCKASQNLGKNLFNYFYRRDKIDGSKSKDTLSTTQFVENAQDLLNAHTDSQQLEYYLKVFAQGKETITTEEFSNLVGVSYEMAQFAHHSSCLPDDLISAITVTVMHGKTGIICKYAWTWLCQNCPRLVMWMHRYLCHIFTVGYSTIPKNVETEEEDNETPILETTKSSSCASLHPALIWLLSCILPDIYLKSPTALLAPMEDINKLTDPHKYIKRRVLENTPNHWVALYNSDLDGLSINRFQHHVFDYHGPTIMFITTEEKAMFSVAIDEAWKDSKHFFGGKKAVCLQLIPEFKIIEQNEKMIYFNQTSRGFPMGIQIGQERMNKAITIDTNLVYVNYKGIPYKLKSLEVWGCGCALVKQHQAEFKRVAKQDAECRRKVKMTSAEWAENPDRYLLELGGRRPSYAEYKELS